MMSKSIRVQRVERELQQTLAQYLLHEMGTTLPCYASITAVETSPDLRHARVYFRIVGNSSLTGKTEELLTMQRNLMQKYLARNLQMRYCPVLKLVFGTATEHSEIDILLEQLNQPKAFRYVDGE